MASLTREASKLQKRKMLVSKLKRQSERELEKASTIAKRSSSGLVLLQKKVESSREQLEDVAGVLTQRLAQQESIQRLVAAAEDRLKREKDTKEQIEQELEFADSEEEKQRAQNALKTISDRIEELIEEIKQRNKTAKKITQAIEDYQKSKSSLSSKIVKQVHKKPDLRQVLRDSQKASKKLAKQVATRAKQEESAKATLSKINKKLSELAKKRKAAKKSRKAKSKAKKSKAKSKAKKSKVKSKAKKVKRKAKSKSKKRR